MSKKHTWKDLSRYEWRTRIEHVDGHQVRIKQRRQNLRIDSGYITFTIDELEQHIQEHGLEEVEFEVDTEWDYGDQRSTLNMKGWRDATEKEIREALDKLDSDAIETESRQADQALRQMEALKQSNPALFEEALKAIAATKE